MPVVNKAAVKFNTDSYNVDNYSNVINHLTGLGVAGSDSINNTQIAVNRYFSYNRYYLDNVFKELWACRKVCEYLPFMMARAWGTLTLSDGNHEIISEANKKILELKELYFQGQTMANLYGGASVVRLVNDGKEPHEPIDFNNIKSVRYSRVFDRWEIQPDPFEVIAHPYDPDYYLFYSIYGGETEFNNSYRIHKSRILRFRGDFLPLQQQRTNNGWEESVLAKFLPPLLRYINAINYAGEAVRTFEIMAHNIKGLYQKTQNAQQEQYLKNRLALNKATLSAINTIALDADGESISFIGRQFRGVTDILEHLKDEMIGASGLTKPQFYQEHPAGLAATGESEKLSEALAIESLCDNKWYKNITQDVEIYLADKRSKTKGKIPDDWGWEWTPLYSKTPSEESDILLKIAQADAVNIQNGIYDAEEARNSHYSGSKFDPNITLDGNRPKIALFNQQTPNEQANVGQSNKTVETANEKANKKPSEWVRPEIKTGYTPTGINPQDEQDKTASGEEKDFYHNQEYDTPVDDHKGVKPDDDDEKQKSKKNDALQRIQYQLNGLRHDENIKKQISNFIGLDFERMDSLTNDELFQFIIENVKYTASQLVL